MFPTPVYTTQYMTYTSKGTHRVHGGGTACNSKEFVCLHEIPLKKHFPSDSQETYLQIYIHVSSLEVKMV